MTRKKEREAAFLGPNAGIGHLSVDMTSSARQALQRALSDRRRDVVRLRTNHYSPNAAATVVLVTTALDISMNEVVAMGAVFGSTVQRALALPATCTKFANVASGHDGFEAAAKNLRLLVDLRDEIVHYLPRSELSGGVNVPEWCRALHEQGLFIEAPGCDYQFSQKIPSYALAYWSFDVAYETIRQFVACLPEATQRICDYVVHNFGLYGDICPPAALDQFDAAYDLELTVFDPVAPAVV